MSKHTPGPWEVDNDFQEEGTYANCFVVHTTPPLPGHPALEGRGEHPPEVREAMAANCRLIAAAPELLAELALAAEALDFAQSCTPNQRDSDLLQARRLSALRVIADATGENK
tara:strand:+ start:2808 stop:3146 length:339 start_codon:yes stop_codon:yes gene_type:complete